MDETYREMDFSGPTPLAAGLGPRCISVASMSKSYGLPGIRIGWIITRDKALQETFLAAKEQIFICNSVVDEEIAFRVLARKEEILPPILAKNRRAFETVRSWIAGQTAIEWVEPSGGVVCFPRIRPESRGRRRRLLPDPEREIRDLRRPRPLVRDGPPLHADRLRLASGRRARGRPAEHIPGG